MLLSDYVAYLRRLVHDPDDSEWDLDTKTLYINKGRSQVVLCTGCNVQEVPITFTQGNIFYDFPSTDDGIVSDIHRITYEWGNTNIVMRYRTPYEMDRYREVLQISRPLVWTVLMPNQLIINPQPDQDYQGTLKATVIVKDLINTAGFDTETIPFPYTEAVCFWAAFLCYADDRDWADANQMQAQFYAELRKYSGTAVARRLRT